MNHLNLRDLFLTKVKNIELKNKAVDVVVEMVSSPLILSRELDGRKIVYIGFNPVDSDIQFRKELPFLLFNCFQWFKQEPEPVTQIAPGKFTRRARATALGRRSRLFLRERVPFSSGSDFQPVN